MAVAESEGTAEISPGQRRGEVAEMARAVAGTGRIVAAGHQGRTLGTDVVKLLIPEGSG